MTYPIGSETGPCPWLSPMHAVMKAIRYTLREVRGEGYLGVFVYFSGNLKIQASF